MKKLLGLLACLLSTASVGATFHQFSPATGVLKGSSTSYVTSAATSADIVSLWSGTCDLTSFLRGDGACVVLSGTGVALSDTPTWTGVHTWSRAEPRLLLNESDQGTDLKLWDLDLNSGILCLRTRTDADGAGQNLLCSTRGTTTTLTNMTFGYSTSGTYTFPFTGTATFSGNLTGGATLTGGGVVSTGGGSTNTGTAPYLSLKESDAGTDLKLWTNDVNGAVWKVRTNTDAGGTGKDLLTFTRGATTAVASMEYGNTTDNPTHKFDGAATFTSSISSAGTKFTASGCSNGTTVGGAVAGKFTSGTTGTCTVTITLPTATNGYNCTAFDNTTPAIFQQTANTTTSCTIAATTVTNDIVTFSAIGF